MPAILQSIIYSKMSTDKENMKTEDVKVEEKGPEHGDDIDSKSDTAEKLPEKPDEKEKEKESNKKKPVRVKESKKDIKSDGEEEEEEEEDEDEKTEEKVPLLDQPLQLSGTRERKKVQRFTDEFNSEPKDVTIEVPEGKGTALGNIPRIESNIQKYKADSLKPLHKVLYNRIGKTSSLKRYIRKFNGFDFDKDAEQYEKKKQILQKLGMKDLRCICDVLSVNKKGNRDEMTDRLMTFLLMPQDLGQSVSKSRPRRTTAKANNRRSSESDEDKQSGSGQQVKGEQENLKDISSDEDGNQADKDGKEKESEGEVEDESASSDESDVPKAKKKKAQGKGTKSHAKKSSSKKTNAKRTPSKKVEKKPAPKKRKSSKSDDNSSEDEPLLKKAKAPPTDDEIKTYVKEILEGANLEEITMKTVCKQVYAHYPEFDLAHKKDFIKTTVKSLIST